jgi:hypothetical protein
MQTRMQLEGELDSLIKGHSAKRADAMSKAFSGFDGGNEMLRMARGIQKGFKPGSFLAQATGETAPFDAAAAGPGDLLADRNLSDEAWAEVLASLYPDLKNVMRPTEEPLPWDLPDNSLLEEQAKQPAGVPDLPHKVLKQAGELLNGLMANGWIEAAPITDATSCSYKHADFPGHLVTINYTNGAWDHELYGDEIASGKGPQSLNDWLAEFDANEGAVGSKKVGVGSRLAKSASAKKAMAAVKGYVTEMGGLHKEHCDQITALGKTHCQSILETQSLSAAKALAKAHHSQMLAKNNGYFAKVQVLQNSHRTAMLSSLS